MKMIPKDVADQSPKDEPREKETPNRRNPPMEMNQYLKYVTKR